MSDIGHIYMRLRREYPVLSRVEQSELAVKAARGDTDAADCLVYSSIGFVMREAGKLAAGHDNELFSDLIQEGLMGVRHAIDKFDPDRGAAFVTYAGWWVKRYMRIYMLRDSDIRIPLKRPEKRELMDARAMARAVVELDDELELESGVESPEDRLERVELRMLALKILSALPARHARMLRLRYGIGAGREPMTLSEVGARLGVCRERARQIGEDALHICRNFLVKEQV